MKMRPKETETPEMLLARFDKRIQQPVSYTHLTLPTIYSV